MPAVGPSVELVARAMPPDADGWPRIADPRGLGSEAAEARKRAIFAAADVALAASGTVSLELAAAGAPMVVGYRLNWLTARIARRLIRLDTVTLVNLVTGTHAVPELLQEDCTPERLRAELGRLLDDPAAAEAQRAAGARAMDILGRGGEPPGLRAARSVLGRLP